MVHENFRWQSPVQAVKRVLDEGAIGTPFWGRISLRSGFDVFSGRPCLAQGKRFIIEDLGIHILDITRFLLGDAVTAQRAGNGPEIALRGGQVGLDAYFSTIRVGRCRARAAAVRQPSCPYIAQNGCTQRARQR